jgi:hypothetical protein
MNWEQWVCPNPSCTDRSWMVQREPANCELWWVAAHLDDRPFMIAATAPICPRCGTTLCTLVELEGTLDRHLGAEVRAMFDLVRSLP